MQQKLLCFQDMLCRLLISDQSSLKFTVNYNRHQDRLSQNLDRQLWHNFLHFQMQFFFFSFKLFPTWYTICNLYCEFVSKSQLSIVVWVHFICFLFDNSTTLFKLDPNHISATFFIENTTFLCCFPFLSLSAVFNWLFKTL